MPKTIEPKPQCSVAATPSGAEPGPFAGELGLSLLVVIVSLAMTTVAASAIFAALANSRFAERVLSTSKAFRDVEGALRTTLGGIVIAKAAGGSCPGAISVASLAFGKGSLSTSTSIPSVLAPAGLLSSAANAQAVAATRCSTARAPAALNTSPADFYFCLTYTPGAGTGALDGASFEKSAGAFVEVRARLFDPRTGTDLSCAGYAAAPLTASVRIGYALYWRSKAAGTPAGAAAGTQAWLHNSKLGFFYAHP